MTGRALARFQGPALPLGTACDATAGANNSADGQTGKAGKTGKHMKTAWVSMLALGAMLASYTLPGTTAHAEPPQILKVEVQPQGDGYRFSVTLEHPDTGWDHYADAFLVYAPDGTQLGERILLHPHVDEQPFTRSLSGVVVPEGITEVEIRAKDNLGHQSEDNPIIPLPDR